MKKFLLSIGLVIAATAISAQTVIDPAVTKPAKDNTDYGQIAIPGSEVLKMTLTNDWIYSSTEVHNKNYPTGLTLGNNCRSMTYAKGKVYLPERGEKLVLHVFDAATGAFIETVVLPEQMFKKADGSGNVVLPCNSITTDTQGRLVLSNLATNIKEGALQVWVMDDAHDKNPVKLIDFMLVLDLGAALPRFDAVDVYGDMKGEGYVLGGMSGAPYVARWDIADGKFTLKGDIENPTEFIDPDVATNPSIMYIEEKSLAPDILNAGTAPLVYPVSQDNFYLDGHAIAPTLLDMNMLRKDGFYDAATGAVLPNAPAVSANGIVDLEAAAEHFLVMGKYNHDPKLPENERNTFSIYHLNGKISEGGATELLAFPSTGLGPITNSAYVVLPRAHTVDANTVEVYIFALANGFGKYTLKVADPSISIVEEGIVAVQVTVDGKTINTSEEVASVEVYNVSGQKVASATNTNNVLVSASGVYIVTIADNAGNTAVHKVLVK